MGEGVEVVADARSARATETAPVVDDDAVTRGQQGMQLGLPRTAVQGPPVQERDCCRTAAEVLVVELDRVGIFLADGDGSHGSSCDDAVPALVSTDRAAATGAQAVRGRRAVPENAFRLTRAFGIGVETAGAVRAQSTNAETPKAMARNNTIRPRRTAAPKRMTDIRVAGTARVTANSGGMARQAERKTMGTPQRWSPRSSSSRSDHALSLVRTRPAGLRGRSRRSRSRPINRERPPRRRANTMPTLPMACPTAQPTAVVTSSVNPPT